MAFVDVNYRFTYVNIGYNGRISDGGVFKSSSLSEALNDDLPGIPPARPPADFETKLSYVIIADDAFSLKKNLLKPFPFRNLSVEQRIFNYRLSRARRIVENVFGILVNRFRILLSPLQVSPDNAEKIVLACCALHNVLRDKTPDCPHPGSADIENLEEGKIHEGSWRSEHGEMPSVSISGSNNCTKSSKQIREEFCNYFNTTGAVPWQEKFI